MWQISWHMEVSTMKNSKYRKQHRRRGRRKASSSVVKKWACAPVVVITAMACFALTYPKGNVTGDFAKTTHPAEDAHKSCPSPTIQEDKDSLQLIIEEPTRSIVRKSAEPAKYTAEEKQLLVQLAMAEAEGESLAGKAHVIRLVLNRVEHEQFPGSIKEVIYQKTPTGAYQFSPIETDRWYMEPSQECYTALDMVILEDWDNTQGALYFEAVSNGNNTWHTRNLEYLYTEGNHRFYK